MNSYTFINDGNVMRPYVSVVLRSRVGLRFIQRNDKQAALDGLQDGLIVPINAY